MKIIKNILSEDLFNKCRTELSKKFTSFCWGSSPLFWPRDILIQQSGACMVTPVSPELFRLLKKELKSHLPKCKKLICQYYVWLPHSGISLHNDPTHIFGATIYLNKLEWSPSSGGWFIWKDTETPKTGVYKSILPKKNVMVLNDKREWHLVTSVASGCLEHRYTIQVWGNA